MSADRMRILHATIAAPFAAAHEWVYRRYHTCHVWVAEKPEGQAVVRFSERDAHEMLDL